MAQFVEADHPRAEDGKFTDGAGKSLIPKPVAMSKKNPLLTEEEAAQSKGTVPEDLKWHKTPLPKGVPIAKALGWTTGDETTPIKGTKVYPDPERAITPEERDMGNPGGDPNDPINKPVRQRMVVPPWNKKWRDDLTDDEVQMLRDYSHKDYRVINSLLNGHPLPEEDQERVTEKGRAFYDHMRDTLQAVIEKHPRFKKPITVWRHYGLGMENAPNPRQETEKRVAWFRERIGQTVRMPGFKSTTTNAGADALAGTSRPLFEIETTRGIPLTTEDKAAGNEGPLKFGAGRDLTLHNYEREVLLGHNWTYKVIDIEDDVPFIDNNGTPSLRTVIKLEVVADSMGRNSQLTVFREEEHPRKRDGEFTGKGQGTAKQAIHDLADDSPESDAESPEDAARTIQALKDEDAAAESLDQARVKKIQESGEPPERDDLFFLLKNTKHPRAVVEEVMRVFNDWESFGYNSEVTKSLWEAVRTFVGEPWARIPAKFRSSNWGTRVLNHEHQAVIEDVIRHSQDYARKHFTDADGNITVYRGINADKVEATGMKKGQTVRVLDPKVMESWTLDPSFAAGYAVDGGLVLRRVVKPEDVAFVGDYTFHDYNNQAHEVTLLDRRKGYHVPPEDVLTAVEAYDAPRVGGQFNRVIMDELLRTSADALGVSPYTDESSRQRVWAKTIVPRLEEFRRNGGDVEKAILAMKDQVAPQFMGRDSTDIRLQASVMSGKQFWAKVVQAYARDF